MAAVIEIAIDALASQLAIDVFASQAMKPKITGVSINPESGEVSLQGEVIAIRTTEPDSGDLNYYSADANGNFTKPLYSIEVWNGKRETIIYDEDGNEFASVSTDAVKGVSKEYSEQYKNLTPEQLKDIESNLPIQTIIEKLTPIKNSAIPKEESCITQNGENSTVSQTDSIIYKKTDGSFLSVTHTGNIDAQGLINNPKDTISFTDSSGQSCTLDADFLKTQAKLAQIATADKTPSATSKSRLCDGTSVNSSTFAVNLPDLPKSCDDFKPIKTAKVDTRGR